jgi:hypothetical protein
MSRKDGGGGVVSPCVNGAGVEVPLVVARRVKIEGGTPVG